MSTFEIPEDPFIARERLWKEENIVRLKDRIMSVQTRLRSLPKPESLTTDQVDDISGLLKSCNSGISEVLSSGSQRDRDLKEFQSPDKITVQARITELETLINSLASPEFLNRDQIHNISSELTVLIDAITIVLSPDSEQDRQ